MADNAIHLRMTRSTITLVALAAIGAATGTAQRVTPALLEARETPKADTTLTLHAGDRDLVAELRVPSGKGSHPLVIVIHGGCWVTKFADARYMYPLAEALRTNGFATWTISYRRADENGGGWPGTFLDVRAAAEQVRQLAPRYHLDLARVIATGHSAGAHLALWLASQRKLPDSSGVKADRTSLRIAAVVAIDGPGDLAPANQGITQICGGPVLEQLLGGVPSSNPERWRNASPAEWLPLGVPQAMVRGGLDWRMATLGPEAGTMSSYARRAYTSGDSAWVVMSDSTSHFTMLDPQQPAFAVLLRAMQDALTALKRGR